ncbi:MAG: hypothetical protein AAF320_06810, partial [Myxococcota bacterium]
MLNKKNLKTRLICFTLILSGCSYVSPSINSEQQPSRQQQQASLTVRDIANRFAKVMPTYKLTGPKRDLQQLQSDFEKVFSSQTNASRAVCGDNKDCLGYVANSIQFGLVKNRLFRFLQQCKKQAKGGFVALYSQGNGFSVEVKNAKSQPVCQVDITSVKALFSWQEKGNNLAPRLVKLGVNLLPSSANVLVDGVKLQNQKEYNMLLGTWLFSAKQPYSVEVEFSSNKTNKLVDVRLKSDEISKVVMNWRGLTARQQKEQLEQNNANLQDQLEKVKKSLREEIENKDTLAQDVQEKIEELNNIEEQLRQTQTRETVTGRREAAANARANAAEQAQRAVEAEVRRLRQLQAANPNNGGQQRGNGAQNRHVANQGINRRAAANNLADMLARRNHAGQQDHGAQQNGDNAAGPAPAVGLNGPAPAPQRQPNNPFAGVMEQLRRRANQGDGNNNNNDDAANANVQADAQVDQEAQQQAEINRLRERIAARRENRLRGATIAEFSGVVDIINQLLLPYHLH